MTTERLFVGIPLAEGVRASLREWLAAAALPGRLVPPGNWHLTLRFLGSTPPESRQRLAASLAGADLGGPIPISFGGLGAFPNARRASVLWLGVIDGVDGVRRLAARVEAAARTAGFPAEPRPVAPHLTLSRLRPPGDVRHFLEHASVPAGVMAVDAVVLYRSHLGNGPARYEELERFPLTARE